MIFAVVTLFFWRSDMSAIFIMYLSVESVCLADYLDCQDDLLSCPDWLSVCLYK